MAKLFTVKRIACLILIVLSIIGTVSFGCYTTSNGREYTEEYKVYQKVEALKTLSEVRTKLQEIKVEYSIANNTLSLKDYDHITFTIKNDDSCFVNSDKHMNGFKKMDDEDRSCVSIHGILIDGKMTEKISLYDDGLIYTKIEGHYYSRYSTVALLCMIACFATLSITSTILVLDIVKKRNRIFPVNQRLAGTTDTNV